MEHALDYLFGALAATVRVAIGHERGEKLSYTKIYITSVSSIIIGGTSGHPLAEYANLPATMGHFIAFTFSFFAVGLVYQVYDGKLNIPFLNMFIKPPDAPAEASKTEEKK